MKHKDDGKKYALFKIVPPICDHGNTRLIF